MRRRMLALVIALVCAGCSSLPVSGEVHTRPADTRESANQVPYFAPAGPSEHESQEGIVRGFLLAMQANPPSTAVARSFLTAPAKATWKPSEGTIVYDAATVETTGEQVSVKLRGAHRLTPEGAWLDGTSATTATVPLSLVQEKGQWRIADPPDELAVPASYFASLYVPFNLYFFDRTGTVLVPSRVYLPAGEQTATNLVRGLISGPPPGLRQVAVTAFPGQADLDLGVVVNDAGIAEVPLGQAVLDLAPPDLNRLVVQLAWTLQQVPGINRLRLTVDGAPIPLSDGRTDAGVGVGSEYNPLMSSKRDLLAIAGGRVIRDDGDRGSPVSGPFGQTGFSLRSIAWNSRDHLVAGVADSGRQVFIAPDRGSASVSRVRTVLTRATDVLRPAYDRFGGLWFADATKAGAVMHLVQGGRRRVVQVPGISGRPVSAFTVTRDGTRLVAVLANGTNPTVEVSNLVRDAHGGFRRALPAQTIEVSDAELGPARDVAQNGPTTVVVLTRPANGSARVVFVDLDGSPGPQGPEGSGAPDVAVGDATGLVASPDPVLPLRVVAADGRLLTLADGSNWSESQITGVVAAAYAQ